MAYIVSTSPLQRHGMDVLEDLFPTVIVQHILKPLFEKHDWLLLQNDWDMLQDTICVYAAQRGALELLQWALARRKQDGLTVTGDFFTDLAVTAIWHNQMHVVKWCLTYNCGHGCAPVSCRCRRMMMIAMTRHAKMLPLIHKHHDWVAGSPLVRRCMLLTACLQGNLTAIKYLVDSAFVPLVDTDTACAEAAACGGHLHVLKWLTQRGAPIVSDRALECAIRAQSEGCVLYILTYGVPMDRPLANAAAMEMGTDAICEMLSPIKVNADQHVRLAVSHGNLAAFRWMVDECGAGYDICEVLRTLVYYRNQDMLHALRKQGYVTLPEYKSGDILDAAEAYMQAHGVQPIYQPWCDPQPPSVLWSLTEECSRPKPLTLWTALYPVLY